MPAGWRGRRPGIHRSRRSHQAKGIILAGLVSASSPGTSSPGTSAPSSSESYFGQGIAGSLDRGETAGPSWVKSGPLAGGIEASLVNLAIRRSRPRVWPDDGDRVGDRQGRPRRSKPCLPARSARLRRVRRAHARHPATHRRDIDVALALVSLRPSTPTSLGRPPG